LEDLKPSNFALMIENMDDLVRDYLAEGNSSEFRAGGHQSNPPEIKLRIPISQGQLPTLSIQLLDFGSG
jgi:hypothetical protein